MNNKIHQGGQGSGNFGHSGRKGEIGGSLPTGSQPDTLGKAVANLHWDLGAGSPQRMLKDKQHYKVVKGKGTEIGHKYLTPNKEIIMCKCLNHNLKEQDELLDIDLSSLSEVDAMLKNEGYDLFNGMTTEMAREVGIQFAVYHTVGDNRVCEACDRHDGAIKKIDGRFALPPRHPNCACFLEPIVPDDFVQPIAEKPANEEEYVPEGGEEPEGSRVFI